MLFKKLIYVTLSILFISLFSIRVNFAVAQTVTPTETPTNTPVPSPTQIPSATSTPAPTPTPTIDTKQVNDLQNKINDYQNKISDLQNQEKTLSSQIQLMDTQINLTELRIANTEQQIISLQDDIKITKDKISNLQDSIDIATQAMIKRISAVYEFGSVDALNIFLTSDNVSNLLTRLKYLRIVQISDKKNIYASQQAKVDYSNFQSILELKKKQVEVLQGQLKTYQDQLDQEKQTKQQLLSDTQGSEANYQELLAQAQAQLAALSSFARSRAGAGGQIIPHQDLSDGWGKYYNQRDANWGNNLIGLSSMQVWEVGCLLTSYAMVASHFGGSLTPADVAVNTSNFWYGTADFNKPGPSANGHSVQSIDNPSLDDLRSALNSGAVVIAGLSANGGPYPSHYSDHWVVLRSVDGNSFKINDPWYQNGMDVSLNDNYSGWSIIESRIYR